MRDGRLPDPELLARALYETGAGATLRGVEATVEGRLVRTDGEPRMQLSGTGEVVRLAPLRSKVQWNVAAKREQAATNAERQAYRRLLRQQKPESAPVRVIGPLILAPGEGVLTLEVRAFEWIR
jgi:hypothetical protein